MKQLVIILLGSLAAVGLTGCLKDSPRVDFSTIKPVVEISTASTVSNPNTLASGLENFNSATLNFAVQDSTVTFYVNYASVNPPTSDVNVTVGVNDAARTSYNGLGGVQFDAMPDSLYSFPTKTGTIKAGTRLVMFTINFYPSKVDPTKSYLLPISVTNASGNTISGNFSTIYLHIIGNPLAGSYNQEWIRYNNNAGTGTPAFDRFSTNTFTAVSPTAIAVSSGTGVVYILTFTNNNGVLSNFQVSFDPASVTAAGITITSGPTILKADPVNHIFKFNFTYNNSAGSPRNITDIFTQ